jgi:DNA-binding GntR family transcriptional regulator
MRPKKWVAIADVLEERILDGTYPPSSLVPPTLELMDEFRVYSATIQAAINHLKNKGLIISKGKGRRVVRPIVEPDTKTNLRDDLAGAFNISDVLILEKNTGDLPAGINAPVLLYKISILNKDFEKYPLPVSLIDYYVPADLPVLNNLKTKLLNNNNFFDNINELGIIPYSYDETIKASAPSPQETELLSLPVNEFIPIVKITRHVYDKKDSLIFLCYIRDRADCFIYKKSFVI